MTRFVPVVAVTALLLLPPKVLAQSFAELPPQERGYAIIERSDTTDAGFGTSSVRLTMTLSDPAGR
ncbi:MAG: hypothetical protein AAF675_13630, partial [Pseudomonadota bacterium]